jgi:hypothetical protein
MHTYIHTYIHAYNLGLEAQTRNFAWLTLLTLQWASLMLVHGIVATKAVPANNARTDSLKAPIVTDVAVGKLEAPQHRSGSV